MATDKTEVTRRRLLEAAAKVFAKQGYLGASVDDVAREAGLTKGAVYWNFSSKEELFLALVRERQTSLVGSFFAAADSPPDEFVSDVTDVYRAQAPDPAEWKLWMEFLLYGMRKPALARRIRREGNDAFGALVERLDAQLGPPTGTRPLSTALLARLYVALFDGMNQQRAIDPTSVDDEAFAQILRFIEDAYAALTTE